MNVTLPPAKICQGSVIQTIDGRWLCPVCGLQLRGWSAKPITYREKKRRQRRERQ